MNDQRREILNQVASGRITAEEGAARLEALESEAAAKEAIPTQAAAPSAGIRQVTVNSRFGNTEIVGDPTVATAVADGPHRARQDGDAMVIDQSLLSGETTFEFNRSRISIPGFNTRDKLIVRMNPALALRMRVQAGNVTIRGVRGAITSDVQAGNCIVDGFAGPVNLMVSAGNLEASGRLDGGSSAIRCQMGEVKVNLDRTSNVRIAAHTTMGKVDIEGVRDHVVGTGAGTLDISCTMGDVTVSVG
jgi:SHOCT-like protein